MHMHALRMTQEGLRTILNASEYLNRCKKPNSPARNQKLCPKKPQWLSNDVNASGMGTYAQRNQIDTKTTVKMAKVISTPPDGQKRNLTHLLV